MGAKIRTVRMWPQLDCKIPKDSLPNEFVKSSILFASIIRFSDICSAKDVQDALKLYTGSFLGFLVDP